MLSVIIVIHLMLVLGLIGVVLLQKSEGGGLVSSTRGFMTGRGTANVLTRTTAFLAAGFFVTSLLLSWIAGFEPQAGLDHQHRRAGEPRNAGCPPVAAVEATAAAFSICSRKAPANRRRRRPRAVRKCRSHSKCRSRNRRLRYPIKAPVSGPGDEFRRRLRISVETLACSNGFRRRPGPVYDARQIFRKIARRIVRWRAKA